MVEATSVLLAVAALKAQRCKREGPLLIVVSATSQVPAAHLLTGRTKSMAPSPVSIPMGKTVTQTATAVKEIIGWPLLDSGAASVRWTHAMQGPFSKTWREM